MWILLGVTACIMQIVFLLNFHSTPTSLFPSRQREQSILMAIDAYEVDTGHYPPSLEALLVKDAETNWHGPYIQSTNTFLDVWGHRFRYKARGDTYVITSAGPDGKFDTADDISN